MTSYKTVESPALHLQPEKVSEKIMSLSLGLLSLTEDVKSHYKGDLNSVSYFSYDDHAPYMSLGYFNSSIRSSLKVPLIKYEHNIQGRSSSNVLWGVEIESLTFWRDST